jgi:hypothetical protein
MKNRHVQPSQPDGVDGEEVAGDDPGGLLAQELRPTAARAPRRRIQPVAAECRADRGRRHLHAKPLELSFDPLVAPSRVLLGEADDQLLHLLIQRWPTGLAVRVGPRPGDQPPMPAQQRLGLHEEDRPAGSGQDAADRGEQRPIGGVESWPWGLAAQDGELVTQHQDL